jgi:hypothetical protein
LRRWAGGVTLLGMAEPVIYREEVVALLFNVSDILVGITELNDFLRGDDGEAEDDEG